MAINLTLSVNDTSIKTNRFIAEYIAHTISGMLESLKGTGEIKHLMIIIDENKLAIELNGTKVPTNKFTGKLIISTISGMLANLKGVNNMKKVNITLTK